MGEKAEEYPVVECRECGEKERASYNQETRTQMVSKSLCFNCLFWLEYVDKANSERVIRVKQTHYHLPTRLIATGNKNWLGFGGIPWWIKTHDGRLIHTNNLWCQGGIPERFQDRLPDNAVFLSKAEFEAAQPKAT